MLIVSDTERSRRPGGTNVLDDYDPDTFAFIQRLPVARPGLRLRPGRRRPGRPGQRLVPVQRQRRRQPGPHDDHARRHQRQRLAVHQRPDADDQPLRRQRQPGRHRDRQCRRRPQRRHRLDGAHLGQLPGADPRRRQDQPRRVHDQRPGRHGGPYPVHGDLDQPGRGQRHQLPGLDHDGHVQRQRPADQRRPQRLHDRRPERHRRDRDRRPHADLQLPDAHRRRPQRRRSAAWSTSRARRSRPTTSRSRPTRCRRSSSRARSPRESVLPAGDLTEVVTFSEPMDTALTNPSSFDLFGDVRNVHYAAASFSWDPTGTQLTINYTTCRPTPTRSPSSPRGFPTWPATTWPATSSSTSRLPFGTGNFPTLTPFLPLGSLVYQGTSRSRSSPRRTTSTPSTWRSIPSQTLAVLVTPVSPDMTATVTLDLAQRQRDRHGDLPAPGPRRSSPPSRARRAEPTRSRSPADRANTRSRPRSTPSSTRPPTAARPTARSPRPSRSIPMPTSSSATTTARPCWARSRDSETRRPQ